MAIEDATKYTRRWRHTSFSFSTLLSAKLQICEPISFFACATPTAQHRTRKMNQNQHAAKREKHAKINSQR